MEEIRPGQTVWPSTDLQSTRIVNWDLQTISSSSFNIPSTNPSSLPLVTLSMEHLNTEAGTASLDSLRDLWLARWGNRWVKREEITGEFWDVALVRLHHGGAFLEAHVLGDGTLVFRME